MITLTKKPRVLKKTKSLACLEAELHHDDLLDHLQPAQAVLDLQFNVRPLDIIPNDSLSQKPMV